MLLPSHPIHPKVSLRPEDTVLAGRVPEESLQARSVPLLPIFHRQNTQTRCRRVTHRCHQHTSLEHQGLQAVPATVQTLAVLPVQATRPLLQADTVQLLLDIRQHRPLTRRAVQTTLRHHLAIRPLLPATAQRARAIRRTITTSLTAQRVQATVQHRLVIRRPARATVRLVHLTVRLLRATAQLARAILLHRQATRQQVRATRLQARAILHLHHLTVLLHLAILLQVQNTRRQARLTAQHLRNTARRVPNSTRQAQATLLLRRATAHRAPSILLRVQTIRHHHPHTLHLAHRRQLQITARLVRATARPVRLIHRLVRATPQQAQDTLPLVLITRQLRQSTHREVLLTLRATTRRLLATLLGHLVTTALRLQATARRVRAIRQLVHLTVLAVRFTAQLRQVTRQRLQDLLRVETKVMKKRKINYDVIN